MLFLSIPFCGSLERAKSCGHPTVWGKDGPTMPFWYAGSLLLLIAEIVIRYKQAGETLLIVASVIWIAVIVLTLIFLVPINNRLARADLNAPPEPALAEHGKWDSLHRWRVASLTVAMVCFLVATRLVG